MKKWSDVDGKKRMRHRNTLTAYDIAENGIHGCKENSIELNDMLLVEMFFVL